MSTRGEPQEGLGPAEREPAERAHQPGEQAGASPTESPAEQPAGSVEPTEQPAGSVESPRQPGEETKRRGSISYQDETTTPREPTLAEKRAREQARRRAEEAERARWAEEARRNKRRKRVLIGASVTVGVAAVIALGYAMSGPDTVEARGVGPDNVVVDDSNCVQPAASTGGYYHSGGSLIPIFIGAGGRQYHYTYGGTGSIGQVATGGTTVPPKDATVVTQSGKTIQRGGFGVSKSSTGGSGGAKGGSSGG